MTARMFSYEEELPGNLDALTAVYPVIDRWTLAAKLGSVARHRVTVALSEAITNAIIHAHPVCPDATVYVHLWTEENTLHAEVGDRGEQTWTVPATMDFGRWEQTGGRGLPLIRHLAHDFAIERRAGGGTLLRMTFPVDVPAISAADDQEQSESNIPKNTRRCHPDIREGEEVMDCRLESHADVDVLHVAGRLDLVSSNTLKDSVRQRLQQKRTRLVLEMRGLDFINSSGLGALVSIFKDVRLVNGRLILAGLAPYVQEIFEITQLTNVFEICKTESDAIQSFGLQTQPVAATV